MDTLLSLEKEPGSCCGRARSFEATEGTLGSRGIRINGAVVGMHVGREREQP